MADLLSAAKAASIIGAAAIACIGYVMLLDLAMQRIGAAGDVMFLPAGNALFLLGGLLGYVVARVMHRRKS